MCELEYRRECCIDSAAQEPQYTSMRRRSAFLDERWSGFNRWKWDCSQLRGAGVRVFLAAGGHVARMRALLAKVRTRGQADRCRPGIAVAGMQESGRSGVQHIVLNCPVHRWLWHEEVGSEEALERFPGLVSRGQSRQTAARRAEIGGRAGRNY